jgi:hypothetical protein
MILSMERYKLVYYPPIKEVAEKMTLPIGSPDRFSVYSGRILGATFEDSTPTYEKKLFKDFLIDPSRLETIADNTLGHLAIIGTTLEGEPAKVDVNPFSEDRTFGTLEIGEA